MSYPYHMTSRAARSPNRDAAARLKTLQEAVATFLLARQDIDAPDLQKALEQSYQGAK